MQNVLLSSLNWHIKYTYAFHFDAAHLYSSSDFGKTMSFIFSMLCSQQKPVNRSMFVGLQIYLLAFRYGQHVKQHENSSWWQIFEQTNRCSHRKTNYSISCEFNIQQIVLFSLSFSLFIHSIKINAIL